MPDLRHEEAQPLIHRVPGIAGEVVHCGGGREDEQAEARLRVLPRVRDLDRLTARAGARHAVHGGGGGAHVAADREDLEEPDVPGRRDLLLHAGLELLLHHGRAIPAHAGPGDHGRHDDVRELLRHVPQSWDAPLRGFAPSAP
ncbi:hypothetical protein UK14_13560 [Streptomyces sp. NRRL F-4428]|nr:hypothetical protein UK14_13560 [Streptomyces sp. NRRL F-4428]